ncbi:MAG: hypothetical protein WC866_03560 [Patescibacteria group bacterium]|jgi:hypothetical protein
MTTSTETPILPETKLWTERVGAFAKTLGLTLDVVNEKLKALIGDPSDDNVATLADPDCASDDDLVAAFSDVPKAKVKRAVKEFRAAAAPPPATQVSSSPSATNASFTSLLPQVPSDDDFLAMLQIGGVAKMEPQDVMSAIRVLFASEIGVFDIDNEILGMIEQRSLSIDEPCPEIYYTLQKQIGRKAHGEVLKALGVPGTFASGTRKTAFVERMKGLWGTLSAFQQGIDSWFASWQAKMNNPALLIGMFATMANGNAATPLAGINDAPDTQPTVDAARSVIDALNKIFAGPGIPVARALAADAVQLRQLLENPELVSAVGAGTREEMLRKLRIGVGGDIVRGERAITQYVLSVMKLPDVDSLQLPMYITALQQLGTTLPWSKLASGNGVRATAASGRALRDGAPVPTDRQRF